MIKIQVYLEGEDWTIGPLKIFCLPYIAGDSMAEGM